MRHIEIKHETIRKSVYGIVIFGFMWYLSYKFFDVITNLKITDYGIDSPFSLLLVLSFLIYVVYGIFVIFTLIVDGFYYLVMRDEKWYDDLTQYTIKIPLTKRMYKQIENKFLSKKSDRDTKPSFDYYLFGNWAKKTMDKELKKLIKGDDKK